MNSEQFAPNYELVIDNFAGGGGASTGIESAIGRAIDIAINHDEQAIAMHRINHPQTKHYCESVWDIDPIEVTNGQPVGLVWLSPDCKHFSKAKGGKPVEKKIRGLAWVALRWIAKVKPRVVMLENVEEFKTWGPLIEDESGNTYPDPNRRGETFNSFVRQIESHGYKVEFNELRACDYGAPTIRKRLFMIARRDGLPIVWPVPTHGSPESIGVHNGEFQPWRTAGECIDWSIPCPSIFDRKKPLAEATLKRVAKGIMRYVVESANPFIIGIGGPAYSRKPTSSLKPIGTLPASGNYKAVVCPTIVPIAHYNGSTPTYDANKPLNTITAHPKGGSHALATAFLAKHFTGKVGSDLNDPIGTVTAIDHHSLVTASIIKFNTGAIGFGLDEPTHTITAGGTQKRPGTACTMGLVTSNLVKHDENNETLISNHANEVKAFLISYYGNDSGVDELDNPLRTITSRERFGLVTIQGQEYQIVDIGLRMLTPRELYRAQGFPEYYIIGDDPNQGLSLPKYAQVRMCGNSVSPNVAEALVKANFNRETSINQHVAA